VKNIIQNAPKTDSFDGWREHADYLKNDLRKKDKDIEKLEDIIKRQNERIDQLQANAGKEQPDELTSIPSRASQGSISNLITYPDDESTLRALKDEVLATKETQIQEYLNTLDKERDYAKNKLENQQKEFEKEYEAIKSQHADEIQRLERKRDEAVEEERVYQMEEAARNAARMTGRHEKKMKDLKSSHEAKIERERLGYEKKLELQAKSHEIILGERDRVYQESRSDLEKALASAQEDARRWQGEAERLMVDCKATFGRLPSRFPQLRSLQEEPKVPSVATQLLQLKEREKELETEVETLRVERDNQKEKWNKSEEDADLKAFHETKRRHEEVQEELGQTQKSIQELRTPSGDQQKAGDSSDQATTRSSMFRRESTRSSLKGSATTDITIPSKDSGDGVGRKPSR
jgi:hypothetical protein